LNEDLTEFYQAEALRGQLAPDLAQSRRRSAVRDGNGLMFIETGRHPLMEIKPVGRVKQQRRF
jgi:hypothetical protein